MDTFLCAYTCQAYTVCLISLLFASSCSPSPPSPPLLPLLLLFFHKPAAFIASWKNVTQENSLLFFFFFFFASQEQLSSALHGEMHTALT